MKLTSSTCLTPIPLLGPLELGLLSSLALLLLGELSAIPLMSILCLRLFLVVSEYFLSLNRSCNRLAPGPEAVLPVCGLGGRLVEELLELCGVILVCEEEADDSGRGEGRDRLIPWLLSSIFQVVSFRTLCLEKRGRQRKFGDR